MRNDLWIRAGLAALMCCVLACDKRADEPFDDTPLTPELAAGSIVDTLMIEVAPYKRGCSLLEDTTCLIAEALAEPDIHGYEFVWGLDFEWGYRYLLEINIVEMPANTVEGDGFVWNYELVEVAEEVAELDEEFILPAYAFAITPGENSGELLDTTPFVCASELVCSLLGDTLGSQQVRVGFGEAPGDPLVVLELL